MKTGNDAQDSADAFERRVKADLHELVSSTSPELCARIARATDAALREGERPPRRWLPGLLLPMSGLAALGALVVVVNFSNRPGDLPAKPSAVAADDVALLLNVDNLDLLEQMEFYLWLEREPSAFDDAAEAVPRLPRST